MSNKMYNNKPHQYQHQLFEGLEMDDLARLVHPKLHIDEFQSKMGNDSDIIVLSFKVRDKQPAQDLMNFIERGYDFVLDADTSSGELDDGEYLVFVEMERVPAAAEQIEQLLKDITNLTGQKLDEWQFQYRKDSTEFDVTEENIKNIIPLSSRSYEAKFPEEQEPEEDEVEDMISAMQESARVPMKRTAVKNDWTESLRVAAGLK